MMSALREGQELVNHKLFTVLYYKYLHTKCEETVVCIKIQLFQLTVSVVKVLSQLLLPYRSLLVNYKLFTVSILQNLHTK